MTEILYTNDNSNTVESQYVDKTSNSSYSPYNNSINHPTFGLNETNSAFNNKQTFIPNCSINRNSENKVFKNNSKLTNPMKIAKINRNEKYMKKKTPLVSNDSNSDNYIPSNENIDISKFTEEDIIILNNILPLAEIHKWKYVSNKLSKRRSKKISAEYCMKKFHEMYGLPFNSENSLLHSNYLLKFDKGQQKTEENFEGMVGSSIPYIVSPEGWNLIDQ